MASVFKRGGKSNRHGTYQIAWFDHKGERKHLSTRTTDKATAEHIAAKLEADAALRREGIIDPTMEAIGQASQRTIDSHLADYEAKMHAAHRTGDHIRRTVGYIREICRWAGFHKAADISTDGVNRFAAKLKAGGKSARTIQSKLTAIKGFAKWLAVGNKLPRDPLLSVRRPNPETDRRLVRRMLLPEEWRWLRTATQHGNDYNCMSGNERVLLYQTAIQTGLRSSELRSLSRGRLFLDDEPPFIMCNAQSTRNRKVARQDIQTDLAAALKEHVASKSPQAPVFAMPPETEVAAMLEADLNEARHLWLQSADEPDDRVRREQSDFLTKVNHDGHRLDFHGLRHTCGDGWRPSQGHPGSHATFLDFDHDGHVWSPFSRPRS